ncbi:MAG TPA: hypothetical protein P5201_11020, partial [Aminobacteriaceae bacterium]|nr:hypothetical protein [Aminobacteriaceae bacterium]
MPYPLITRSVSDKNLPAPDSAVLAVSSTIKEYSGRSLFDVVFKKTRREVRMMMLNRYGFGGVIFGNLFRDLRGKILGVHIESDLLWIQLV